MPDTIKFLDIAQNPHFNAFVAVLGRPFSSLSWKRQRPHISFWTLWDGVTKLLKDEYFANPTSRNQFITRFLEFLSVLTHADVNLKYSEEDMQWLTEVMDGDYALATMSMLFAYASARQEYLSPVQIAEMTGTSESNWRNKAANGVFKGAFKTKKEWLIPVHALRASGVDVEYGETFDSEAESER